MMKQLQHLALGLVVLLLASCAGMHLKNGKTAYDQYRYQDAITALEKGLSKKSDVEGQIKLADSYLRLNQFQQAESTYQQALLNPDITDTERTRYGQSLMSNQHYAEAQTVLEGVLSRDPENTMVRNLVRSCKNTDDLERDSATYLVELVPLSGVQRPYAPAYVDSGLVVTAAGVGKATLDPYTLQPYTDLYFVPENGDFGAARKIDDLNGRYHDAAAAYNASGSVMVFTRSYLKENQKLGADGSNTNNTQLYIRRKSNGAWTEPEQVQFNDIEHMYAHPALSVTGDTMIFASDRMNGYGGMDLYQSTWNGTIWTQPENLGPGINTPGNELFPTWPTEDTLYFSSNGHLSLGGQDLQYSVKREGSWDPPTHLTYPINSSADDFAMAFKSGKEGVFTSDRSGSDQLFSFRHIAPDLRIEGLVSDSKSMQPIEGVTVLLKNLTDGTEERVASDSSGKFNFKLDPGKRYELIAENEDYFRVSNMINTVGKVDDEVIEQVVELERLYISDVDGSGFGDGNPNGSGDGSNGNGNPNDGGNGSKGSAHPKQGVGKYPIPNIYWDYNDWNVRADAEPYLNQLVKVLKDNPELTVQIQSHCDCRGSSTFNNALSQKRAQAVVDYLVSKGVARAKLQSRGKGKSELVNDCDCRGGRECTDAQHGENRRTEFIVVAKN